MYKINKLQHGKRFVRYLISHSIVLYQKTHSFAALTRSISDTSPTHVKIPYARAFHEVISIFFIGKCKCKWKSVIQKMSRRKPFKCKPTEVHFTIRRRVPYNKQLTNRACSSPTGEYWPEEIPRRHTRRH